MYRNALTVVLAASFALALSAASARAQSVGERIGNAIDQVSSGVQQAWQQVKEAGNRMGVEARVYARLRWDKAIHSATIDIEVPKAGTVVLKGSVADAAAKKKAVELANDTIGVDQVIDQLAVAPPATAEKPVNPPAR
jgi:osmotically-inducible protein OsmY